MQMQKVMVEAVRPHEVTSAEMLLAKMPLKETVSKELQNSKKLIS